MVLLHVQYMQGPLPAALNQYNKAGIVNSRTINRVNCAAGALFIRQCLDVFYFQHLFAMACGGCAYHGNAQLPQGGNITGRQ